MKAKTTTREEREFGVLQDQVQRLSRALAKTHDELVCREEEISALKLQVQVPMSRGTDVSLTQTQAAVTSKFQLKAETLCSHVCYSPPLRFRRNSKANSSSLSSRKSVSPPSKCRTTNASSSRKRTQGQEWQRISR